MVGLFRRVEVNQGDRLPGFYSIICVYSVGNCCYGTEHADCVAC